MKSKKLLIALAGCAAFVATACHGDLDIIQDNQLTASNMWTESSDVTTSAYGIYYLMRANFVQDKVNVFYWGEARVGEYMWGAGSWRTGHDNDMYGVQNSTMNDSNASTVWTKLYTAVNAANAVLKYAPTVPMTDADRQWAIGQAAFARAYLYFWAVRLWGDVPLLLNPVESVDAEECYPARSPKAYVYEQIGRDIETAVAYVTSGTDKYVATPDAVNMLKAEYALWMYATQAGGDDYLALADEALKAIGISSARLLDDYASIFAVDNKCNAEVIFALNNNQTEKLTGGYYWTFYWPATNVAPAYQMNPRADLHDAVVELFGQLHLGAQTQQGRAQRPPRGLQLPRRALRLVVGGGDEYDFVPQQTQRRLFDQHDDPRLRPALLSLCAGGDAGRRTEILAQRL